MPASSLWLPLPVKCRSSGTRRPSLPRTGSCRSSPNFSSQRGIRSVGGELPAVACQPDCAEQAECLGHCGAADPLWAPTQRPYRCLARRYRQSPLVGNEPGAERRLGPTQSRQNRWNRCGCVATFDRCWPEQKQETSGLMLVDSRISLGLVSGQGGKARA